MQNPGETRSDTFETRPANGDVVVRVDGYSFSLGEKTILRDVCFEVFRGETLAIVGPNGAGKTTLLKCLDRILVGGTGRIEVFGQPLESYRQKELARRISYVPQADGRVAPFTVEQFVLMGRYPHLSPFTSISRDDRRIAREAMQGTGVLPFADRPLTTLSGGERQKVYIAAALAQGAEVLLLDEPTTFLDYRHQAEIQTVLARANRESGVTMVAVTHDLNQAALAADRIVALQDGRVVFRGPAAGIMQAETLERIYGTPFLLSEHPQTRMPVILPRRNR